jgi:hypothetical protein
MNNSRDVRPFTAFAFLADKLAQGGGLVSGLIPLFAPVVAPLAGKRFEAAKLSDLLADYYGMDIHPYAVEDIAPRLCEQGILEAKNISKNLIEYPASAKYYQEHSVAGRSDERQGERVQR